MLLLNVFINLANIYLLEVSNRNTRSEVWNVISSKLIKIPEQHCRSDVFLVNFEHISNLFLVLLLLIINR